MARNSNTDSRSPVQAHSITPSGGGRTNGNFTGGTATKDAEDDAKAEEEFAEVYELTGYLEFWFGTRPKSIDGKLNPTLELEAGKQYKIRWTNGDGINHSFIIINENGEWIVGTELTEGVGSTKELTFTATEEMSEYFCTVHPQQMRGKVNVSGTTDQGPGGDVLADLSYIKEKSTVTFKGRQPRSGYVTVEKTTLPEGGFVTIHTPRLKGKKHKPRDIRDIKKSVIGFSDYLEPGTHRNIRIRIENPPTQYKKLAAMNHRDTNGNKEYDFVTDGPSFADADWPYFTPKGKAVVDMAKFGKRTEKQ